MGGEKEKKNQGTQGNEERQQRGRGGPPQPGGARAKQKLKAAKSKGEAHQNAPGRPARPTRPQRASTRTPAAVQMDECAPEGYPVPAGYEQPPSGWTSVRPEGTQPLLATNSRRPDGRVSAPQRRPAQQHNTPSGHTGEEEPGGPGHRTRKTTHQAGAPVNRSQEAQDTAHAKQHTARAHR